MPLRAAFQLALPRRERLLDKSATVVDLRVSTRAPAKGATNEDNCYRDITDEVSTRAPAKGAT